MPIGPEMQDSHDTASNFRQNGRDHAVEVGLFAAAEADAGGASAPITATQAPRLTAGA